MLHLPKPADLEIALPITPVTYPLQALLWVCQHAANSDTSSVLFRMWGSWECAASLPHNPFNTRTCGHVEAPVSGHKQGGSSLTTPMYPLKTWTHASRIDTLTFTWTFDSSDSPSSNDDDTCIRGSDDGCIGSAEAAAGVDNGAGHGDLSPQAAEAQSAAPVEDPFTAGLLALDTPLASEAGAVVADVAAAAPAIVGASLEEDALEVHLSGEDAYVAEEDALQTNDLVEDSLGAHGGLGAHDEYPGVMVDDFNQQTSDILTSHEDLPQPSLTWEVPVQQDNDNNSSSVDNVVRDIANSNSSRGDSDSSSSSADGGASNSSSSSSSEDNSSDAVPLPFLEFGLVKQEFKHILETGEELLKSSEGLLPIYQEYRSASLQCSAAMLSCRHAHPAYVFMQGLAFMKNQGFAQHEQPALV
jgi:hypothetical protein